MESDIRFMNELVRKESQFVDRLLDEVGRVVVGQKDMLARILIGLLTGGHILLEGVPGLAKTLTVTSMANAIAAKFQRLQFTPDLLPADIIGTMVYNQHTGEFTPRRGPIFANIVLADEVNRAPAKVQSALLEAMQEKQVTIGDATYKLPPPFLVLATQNPIEQEGTYPLPEAQLDRFMFMVYIDYPTQEEERRIVKATTREADVKPKAVLRGSDVLAIQEIVRRVPISDHVMNYAIHLARATRPSADEAPPFVKEWLTWGAGPRAAQYLVLGAKGRAIMSGRYNVSCKDIRAMALPVLRHRIFTNFNADAEGVTPDAIVEKLLETIPEPDAAEYD